MQVGATPLAVVDGLHHCSVYAAIQESGECKRHIHVQYVQYVHVHVALLDRLIRLHTHITAIV